MRVPASSHTVIGRLLFVTAFVLLALAAPAHAAFPGKNGRFAFSRSDDPRFSSPWHIYTVNPDNSDMRKLTSDAQSIEGDPRWSPDGSRIAFYRGSLAGGPYSIYVMNADGSGQTRLTNGASSDFEPAWSPDGTKLAFSSSNRDGPAFNIYVMNADGSGQPIRLSNSPENDLWPSWSPDGTRIAFSTPHGIDVMNADGTNRRVLASIPVFGEYPAWSPDGTKIAFTSFRDPSSNAGYQEVYVMNADGSGPTRLTNDLSNNDEPTWAPDGTRIAFITDSADCCFIYTMNPDGTDQTTTGVFQQDQIAFDWQPIPQTYPRPKGATPFKTFLVVAYKPCTAPDRTHGAPLSYGSCSSPQPASDFLTVGTGDSNGQAPNSIDSVRYDVLVGNPRTPADEADVAVQIAMRDIRNRSDLSDYTGEIQVTSNLRITDRDNTPSPGGPGPATVQDTPLSATVPCTATADTGIGATCNLTTSEEAITPGAVKEGRRAVWALGQVQAYDGGPDGLVSTPAGNTLFMDEGVFVP